MIKFKQIFFRVKQKVRFGLSLRGAKRRGNPVTPEPLEQLDCHGLRPRNDKNTLSILLCGDFMLDARINPYLKKYGFMYSFKNLLPLLAQYDIRALNLETPISDKPGAKWPDKKFNFQAPSSLARMIARAGFDYAALSNNHILDYGEAVMRDTLANLNTWGVRYSGVKGAPNPVIIERGGKRIAFLSYMDLPLGLLPGGFDKHCEMWSGIARIEIAAAKSQADIVIVSMHWGVETKTAANDRQKKIAHEIINAGASVVWGHHPHVIQEVERYKDGVIFYSLGNFIFSHLTPGITKGMIAGIEFDSRGKISAIRKHIINNDNYIVEYAPNVAK